MTVAELIAKLSKFDQNLPVRYWEGEYGDYLDVEKVEKVIDPHARDGEKAPRNNDKCVLLS